MTKLIFKNLFFTFIALTLLMAIFVFPTLAQNDGTYNFASSSGLTTSANRAGYVADASTSTLEDIIGTVIYIVLGLVGVIFMGFVIYAGVTWMTAQGNPEKVKKANGILNAALFGLIVTLAAYVISYFLITYFQQ